MDFERHIAPIDLNVTILYGSEQDTIGWTRRSPFYEVPGDGSMVKVSFIIPNEIEEPIDSEYVINENWDGESNDPTFFFAEVLYTRIDESEVEIEESFSEKDNHSNIMVLYAGEDYPQMDLVFQLEDVGWTRIDENETDYLVELCSALPPLAGLHNVIILIGEPLTPNFQVWSQSLTPSETEVPPFGRRMMLDPIDSAVEPEDIVPNESGEYDEREINPSSKGSLEKGLPAVVIHSEIVEPGMADIIFWVSSLSDIEGIDLLAAGWAEISVPDEFDPELFEATERIKLALATRIIWRSDESSGLDEDGIPYLSLISYEIEDPATLSPSLYHLLPEPLVEYCSLQRSISEFGKE